MRKKNHEKRFKFRKTPAGFKGCRVCKGFLWKPHRSLRPNRNTALNTEQFDEALDFARFHGMRSDHSKGGKSDRNSNRTFWHDTYQLWRAFKFAEILSES
jgi:hypothetical protein